MQTIINRIANEIAQDMGRTLATPADYTLSSDLTVALANRMVSQFQWDSLTTGLTKLLIVLADDAESGRSASAHIHESVAVDPDDPFYLQDKSKAAVLSLAIAYVAEEVLPHGYTSMLKTQHYYTMLRRVAGWWVGYDEQIARDCVTADRQTLGESLGQGIEHYPRANVLKYLEACDPDWLDDLVWEIKFEARRVLEDAQAAAEVEAEDED